MFQPARNLANQLNAGFISDISHLCGQFAVYSDDISGMEAEVIATNDQCRVLRWREFTLDGNWFPACWQIVFAVTGYTEEYPTENLAMRRFRQLEKKQAAGTE